MCTCTQMNEEWLIADRGAIYFLCWWQRTGKQTTDNEIMSIGPQSTLSELSWTICNRIYTDCFIEPFIISLEMALSLPQIPCLQSSFHLIKIILFLMCYWTQIHVHTSYMTYSTAQTSYTLKFASTLYINLRQPYLIGGYNHMIIEDSQSEASPI